jgi:hypothetical protein
MWVLRFATAAACGLALAGAAAAREAPAGASPCVSDIHVRVVPAWARTGFSDPEPTMPLALGASNRIVAIVFGYPLLSPPGKTRSNKILWVSRADVKPLSDLRIRAQRMAGARPIGPVVSRTVVGGPGPSIVDLPAAGCWRLSLRWSGRTDTLDLAYR